MDGTPKLKRILKRIVSGGQTGVDRGALDAAIWLGLGHGGWCPRGRRSEDGSIPARYKLQETDERDYTVRTERNVVDSDGTLIIFEDALSGGTALTARFAKKHNRPHLLVDLNHRLDHATILNWLVEHEIAELNVAGPREESSPGIGEQARQLLVDVLRDVLTG